LALIPKYTRLHFHAGYDAEKKQAYFSFGQGNFKVLTITQHYEVREVNYPYEPSNIKAAHKKKLLAQIQQLYLANTATGKTLAGKQAWQSMETYWKTVAAQRKQAATAAAKNDAAKAKQLIKDAGLGDPDKEYIPKKVKNKKNKFVWNEYWKGNDSKLVEKYLKSAANTNKQK